jgi:cell division protein FtsB
VLTQNAIESVTLRIFMWKWENVRLFIVILGSAAVGAFVGMFLTFISLMQTKAQMRKLKKENKNLKDELDNLRNISLDEIPEEIERTNSNENQIVKKEDSYE